LHNRLIPAGLSSAVFCEGQQKTPSHRLMRRGEKTMRFSHLLPESRSDPSWNWHLDIEVRDSNRLPWFHRASPSTTRDEFVDINECGYIDGSKQNCQ